MGKPSAPDPPDYAGAAEAQGEANLNAALATNYLNQVSQVGPYGSSVYSYGPGHTLPDGTVVPSTTLTTTLTPAQQQLLDQQNQISSALNNVAISGIGYVDQITGQPLDLSSLPGMATTPPPTYQAPSIADFNSSRDLVTNAYMERLDPMIARTNESLRAQLASQGIELGSEAYGNAMDDFNRGVNDQRVAALLAGDQAVQNLFQNAMQAGQLQFNQGLASNQFQNQARTQALQEQEFLRMEPLNVLNALRTGNQVTLPQFQNAATGSTIQAAPIYQATSDQWNAANQAYQNQLAMQGSYLGGLASIGGAAIMASDRRLKTNIERLGVFKGLGLYAYDYIWGGPRQVGFMADEVAELRPDALGPTIAGFATVDYGVLLNG